VLTMNQTWRIHWCTSKQLWETQTKLTNLCHIIT